MAEAFSVQKLTELVLTHVEAGAATLRFEPIATGKHNSSYRVHSDRGSFVLRVAPPDDAGFLFYEHLMMRQEPQLHALVRARTAVPVAEIVGYGFDRELIDRDYLLMEALPGKPLSAVPSLSGVEFDRLLRQLGTYLRELHSLTAGDCFGVEAHGYLGPHRPMEPQDSWTAAFAVMWNKLLDDVVACGCYSVAEAQVMRDLLDQHWEAFVRPVVPRFLHMDVWSQNVLIDSSCAVTGLVDFDRALWGDVEIEFAVLDYCGISQPAFWQGYGIERDESSPALVRRQFYLLYEIQKYMPIRVWRRNDWSGAQRYKAQSFELARTVMSRW